MAKELDLRHGFRYTDSEIELGLHRITLDLAVAIDVEIAVSWSVVRGTLIPWRAKSVDAFLALPLAIAKARRVPRGGGPCMRWGSAIRV
jgi:hypothetical protein